ncbi:SgcJ/EcaC family oxidoreductase [Arenibacter sp. GZD96]|uniref:YybH family protein n=1 Tax=Aurantibrevibacter litoralis TaxID=3106030 RepID=UPI002AFFCC08|nr:SgcJ/EcaC family oxidoreductase [Arenibacter sp. GZD-96]MEA1786148.1 SgcJ/EcaC family oxidoreductase [Arenibacter sp. GZD-96]
MKNLIKNKTTATSIIILLLLISTGCNNSNKSLEKEIEVTETVFDLAKEKQELQKSFKGVMEALASGDAKAVANFYTEDGVFMPHNSQIFTGREEIEKAFEGFIAGGFTDLDVESTWAEGCGNYLLDTEQWTLSNGKDTLIGKSLVIWKKEDGMWKMYKDMINTDTP